MVIATIIGVVAAGGIGAFTFMGAAAGWASIGLSILTKVVLGAALRALMPKPSVGANRGYETTAIGTALDHQVIYGKVRVGGARIYDETTGTNNSYLHRIIAVAGHEIESFDKIYINDSYVNYADIDANGNISSVVDPDGTTSTRYNDHVRIKFHLGSPTQSADATLVSESAHWTNAHKLSGIAYMYIRMKFDADVFPNGIPDFTAEVKGKKVYDPRTSTTVWSDNPALCVRDYLTASYGISEAVANIDDTLVTSAANVSDQTNTDAGTTRYTCNGAFTTNSTPYEMIEALLTSMDGSIWYAQGKWRMKPAYWTAPVLDLDEDDLRSSLSVSTRHSRASNFNTVKGTFRGSESNWQTTDYPQVPENTASNANPYLAVDNGQESVADVDLTFTDNSIEARRIARITLERNRQQLTVSGSFGLSTLQLQVGDNIRLTNSRFGWTNKEFEVVAWNFGLQDDLDLQVQMTLRETSESVYDEVTDSVVYERDNTTLASPFATAEPQSLSSAATAFVNDDGTTVPSITFSWSVANPSLAELFEFEWKLTTDTNYNSTVLKETSWTLAPAESSKSYDYRVRSISPLGVRSALKYSTSAAATVDDLTVPNAPSGLNVSGGYAATTVEWVAPTANTDASAIKDLFQYEVYRGTSSNPTTLVGRVAGTTFSDIGLANNTTYHYRVKALDFTGNKSAFSSNGSATTNPALTNGTDGSSVLVVYATNTSGSSQSLTAGSREYVQYYEYTGTTPSLPVSGTFVKFVGAGGDDGNSVFPIYATSSAGASQSFNPSGKTFVTFFESATTPSLPVSGQTFVAYVGSDGTDGTNGTNGTDGTNGTNGTNGSNGTSIFPVYATSSAGASQSFSPTGKTFVTFYEGLTSPSLPLSGQTFVAYVGSDGSNGTDGTDGTNGTNGSNGTNGTNGDIFKTIYLYDASVTQPSAISITSGFTPSTGNASSTGTWTTTVPSIGSGQVLWLASMVVKQTAGTGNYAGQSPGWVRIQAQGYDGTNGTNGATGAQGPTGLIDNPYGALAAYSNSTQSTITWDSTEQAMKLQSSSDTGIGAAFPAFRVNLTANETHKLSVKYKSNGSYSSGFYARVYEYNAALPSGKLAVSHNASNSLVQEDTSGKTNWVNNVSVSTTWVTSDYTYTPTAGAEWASIVVLNWTGMGTQPLFIRDPENQLIGSSGPQGIQGIQGNAGTDGTNGTNGTNGTDGTNGSDGSDAPRFASRTLYTNPAVVTPADTTPSATITWSSGAISSITSGWSLTPPTQVASASQKVWTSNLLFSDVSPPFSTTSATGTTAIQGTSFSGLVTFTGGDFALDGATITNIDGGNITTGTIDANQINADAITSKNLKVGSIAIDSSARPTSGAGMFVVGVNNAGASGTTAGDFVVGNAKEFVSWDTSAGVLSIQGEIINVGPEYTNGRLLKKYALERDDLGTATSGNQSLNTLLEELGGSGLFGFGLVGGGGSGAGRETNNDSAKLFGGGAGGMAMFAYEWDGSESVQVNLGVGGAGIFRAINANTNGNAGTNSTFTIAGSVRVTANAGGSGGQTFTNGSLVQSNNAGSVTWADGNNGDTDFPDFSHTCVSGHGGAVSRSNSVACGGGGIQITPWNPTTVFPLAIGADSVPSGVLTANGNGATTGGSPWGYGVLGTTSGQLAGSPYRLEAGVSTGGTSTGGPATAVVHPIGYDGDYSSQGAYRTLMEGQVNYRGGHSQYFSNSSAAGGAGGFLCGSGGANSRRNDSSATTFDAGLGGGGGAALSDSGGARTTTGDGGDGCIVIWRIS